MPPVNGTSEERECSTEFLDAASHLPGSFDWETVEIRLPGNSSQPHGPVQLGPEFSRLVGSLIAEHGVARERHGDDVLVLEDVDLHVNGAYGREDWAVEARVVPGGEIFLRFEDFSEVHMRIDGREPSTTARRGSPALLPGDTFVGVKGITYLVGAEIGRGGAAVVYRARTPTGALAAKCLLPGRFAVEDLVERFEREVAHLAEIADPNVIGFVDEAGSGEALVLVMELAEESLYERLEREPPPLDLALDWLEAILAGLSALHVRGLVHRDLSPRNVVFVDGIAKISDFGTARGNDDADLTSDVAKAQLGSLLYIPSEQRANPHGATASADVFAAGQIAYLMLTGLVPTGNPPPLETFEHVPGEVAATIDQMRSYLPGERFSSAAAALTALRRARSAARAP